MSIFSLSGILLAIGMQDVEYILTLWHAIGDRDAGRGVYSHPLACYWSLIEYILTLWHSIGDRDAGRGVYSHSLAFYWR